MFYIKSKFYQYPIRREEFYGDAVDDLLGKNPIVKWVEETLEIPFKNGNILLWNPCTALHCFVSCEEANRFSLLKKGLPLEELPWHKDFIKHLFFRTIITLNEKTFIPLDIYANGPLYEERYLVELLLSESCNLSCKYCFAEPNKKRSPMSPAIAKAAVDKAMALPTNSFTIEFGGGETFLYYKTFTDIVKVIRKKADEAQKNVQILVQTNGTLLHRHEIMRFLEKYHVEIGISMDGPPEINDMSRPSTCGQGSSQDVLKSIKLLHHFGKTNIPFLTVVNRCNLENPEKIVDYFNSLGSNRGMFLPTLKLGAAETAWDEMGIEPHDFFNFMKRILEHSEYGKKLRCLIIKRMLDNLINPTRDFRCMRSCCGAGKDYIVVDSRGDIFPCSHHVHRQELKMGNINDTTPMDQYFFQNPLFKELANTRKVHDISTCRCCFWRHLCEAGCSLDSYYHYGHMQGRSTLCGYYQKMYPFLLQCCLEHPEMITAYLEEEVEIISFFSKEI